MSPDGLDGFEAMIGAFANLGEREPGLGDARCPKCDARDFVKVEELFDAAVRRSEIEGSVSTTPGIGGLSDEQVIVKFRPPRRRGAKMRTVAITIPIAIAAYFVYRRFGEVAGEFALMATAVIAIMTFLTTTRRLSDQYYERRAAWLKLYLCQRCGQVVRG